QPLSDYAAQRRGGRGKSATSMKEDDYIQHLIVTSSHATVLCFTNVGKVYRLKVYEVPQASRGDKGRPMVNLLPLDENETITAILPVIDAPNKFKERLADFKAYVKADAAQVQDNEVINAHFAERGAALTQAQDGADDISDPLRIQRKPFALGLSATERDD